MEGYVLKISTAGGQLEGTFELADIASAHHVAVDMTITAPARVASLYYRGTAIRTYATGRLTDDLSGSNFAPHGEPEKPATGGVTDVVAPLRPMITAYGCLDHDGTVYIAPQTVTLKPAFALITDGVEFFPDRHGADFAATFDGGHIVSVAEVEFEKISTPEGYIRWRATLPVGDPAPCSTGKSIPAALTSLTARRHTLPAGYLASVACVVCGADLTGKAHAKHDDGSITCLTDACITTCQNGPA